MVAHLAKESPIRAPYIPNFSTSTTISLASILTLFLPFFTPNSCASAKYTQHALWSRANSSGLIHKLKNPTCTQDTTTTATDGIRIFFTSAELLSSNPRKWYFTKLCAIHKGWWGWCAKLPLNHTQRSLWRFASAGIRERVRTRNGSFAQKIFKGFS